MSKFKILTQKLAVAWLSTFDAPGGWFKSFKTVPEVWRWASYGVAILAALLALATAKNVLTGLDNYAWILPLYVYVVAPAIILGVMAMVSLETLIDEDVDAILAERRSSKRSWWANIYFRLFVYAVVGCAGVMLFETAAVAAYADIVVLHGHSYPPQAFVNDARDLLFKGVGTYLIIISGYELFRTRKTKGGRHA